MDVVLRTHLVDGRPRRASWAGAVGAAATVLDDHGNLAEGLLSLHQGPVTRGGWRLPTRSSMWRSRTSRPRAEGSTTLPTTPRSCSPGPAARATMPSRQAVRLWPVPWTAAAPTGSGRTLTGRCRRSPGGVGSGCCPRAAVRRLGTGRGRGRAAGLLQVAVARRRPGRAGTTPAGHGVALGLSRPVLAYGAPGAPGIPLLRRPAARGRQADGLRVPGFVCDAPVTGREELQAVLA